MVRRVEFIYHACLVTISTDQAMQKHGIISWHCIQPDHPVEGHDVSLIILR